MARTIGLTFVLCFIALANAQEMFTVEGDVYCDPCRVQFVNDLSEKLADATVQLECRDLKTKAVTYSVWGKTGGGGHYNLEVIGDHANDSCEVSVVESGRDDCTEPMADLDRTRIECTANSGIHAGVRYANPIGFMTKVVDSRCGPMLFKMGIVAPKN